MKTIEFKLDFEADEDDEIYSEEQIDTIFDQFFCHWRYSRAYSLILLKFPVVAY